MTKDNHLLGKFVLGNLEPAMELCSPHAFTWEGPPGQDRAEHACPHLPFQAGEVSGRSMWYTWGVVL